MLGHDDLIKNTIYNIYIYSTSTGEKVQFPAFLTSFSDSFKSNWNSTNVYGKMDPIVSFKNTSRSISVGFDIPNQSIREARENMIYLDTIMKGMYPIYTSEFGLDGGGSYVVSSPPMYRVRMANLICNSDNIADFDPSKDNKLLSGLLGYIQDFTFNPDITNGFFFDTNIEDNIGKNTNLLPKLVKVSFTLNVIHEHPLGTFKISTESKPLSRIQLNESSVLNTYPHKFNYTSTGFAPPQPKPSTEPSTSVTEAAKKAAEETAVTGGKKGVTRRKQTAKERIKEYVNRKYSQSSKMPQKQEKKGLEAKDPNWLDFGASQAVKKK